MLVAPSDQNGQSFVELCAGLALSIPIFLAIINVISIGIGLECNGKTCREAARFAASGDPANAELRARSVIAKANQEKGWMIADLSLVSIKNVANPMLVQQANDKSAFSAVEVTSSVCVHPICLGDALYKKRFFTFITSQRFPYTYTAPANAAANTETTSNN
jgi:hypothetical protein